MAISFIAIDKSTRLGGRLRSAIDQLSYVRSELQQLQAIMATLVDGSDYTALATEFGVASASASSMKTQYDAMMTQLLNANVNNVVNRLG